jgi:hypothetical protein
VVPLVDVQRGFQMREKVSSSGMEVVRDETRKKRR